MSYAGILVHVHAAPETSARLEFAVALAKRFDATLIGVGAEMMPPIVPDYGFAAGQGAWLQVMRETIEDNLDRARKAFEAASAGLAKTAIWESGLELPTPAVARASRAADLIVAGTDMGWHENAYRDAATGELVVTAGRPVLTVSAKKGGTIGERVLLAWKDTREARRAMSDAVPFLERAKEVLVAEVCDREEQADAEVRTADVAAALGRRGVKATAKVVQGTGNCDKVIREADAFEADLVVAGGYGHSRLGEWVFGGVTRELLARRDHHILLSH